MIVIVSFVSLNFVTIVFLSMFYIGIPIPVIMKNQKICNEIFINLITVAIKT